MFSPDYHLHMWLTCELLGNSPVSLPYPPPPVFLSKCWDCMSTTLSSLCGFWRFKLRSLRAASILPLLPLPPPGPSPLLSPLLWLSLCLKPVFWLLWTEVKPDGWMGPKDSGSPFLQICHGLLQCGILPIGKTLRTLTSEKPRTTLSSGDAKGLRKHLVNCFPKADLAKRQTCRGPHTIGLRVPGLCSLRMFFGWSLWLRVALLTQFLLQRK